MPKLSTRRKILRAAQTPHTVAEQLQHHMGAIAELFDKPKITLVIRSATLDQPIVATNDQPEETIEAIRKMVTVIQTTTVN